MPVEVAVVAIFGSVGFYLAAIAGIWIVSRARSQRAQIHAEMQTKLVERFGSAPELVEFLQSPAGQQFITGVDTLPRFLAREKIISGVRTAIIFATVGVGFLALCIDPDIRNSFLLFVGTMLIAIGIAFLLAAVASVKLSRSLGLMNGNGNHVTTEPTTQS